MSIMMPRMEQALIKSRLREPTSRYLTRIGLSFSPLSS